MPEDEAVVMESVSCSPVAMLHWHMGGSLWWCAASSRSHLSSPPCQHHGQSFPAQPLHQASGAAHAALRSLAERRRAPVVHRCELSCHQGLPLLARGSGESLLRCHGRRPPGLHRAGSLPGSATVIRPAQPVLSHLLSQKVRWCCCGFACRLHDGGCHRQVHSCAEALLRSLNHGL